LDGNARTIETQRPATGNCVDTGIGANPGTFLYVISLSAENSGYKSDQCLAAIVTTNESSNQIASVLF